VIEDLSRLDPNVPETARIGNLSANPKYHRRSPARIAALFEGLELVEPGVMPVTRWRTDRPEISQYRAVGRTRP